MSNSGFSRRRLIISSLVLFTLSGCAGLIYQSIWAQYLALYLGHAAYAQCLVLAIFMGGMAAGALWVSRVGSRWQNQLRIYAVVELVIGLMAWAFNSEFLGATAFAYARVFPLLSQAWLVDAFKWLGGALLILPQSVLLGMTFPLMSAALMRRVDKGAGSILSALYFTNSLGAACGAVLATFLLLPILGLPGTLRAGACLNFAVALLAWLLSTEAEQRPSVSAVASMQHGVGRLILAAAFITGGTSFIYEVCWVRMLNLALGTTLHSFELMLTAFILGLAGGSLWIRRRIDAYRDPIRVGGYVQLLMGIAALFSLFIYLQSFDWVAWLMHALSRDDRGYTLYNLATAATAVLIMAPAAFFAGMTLPLFTMSLMRDGRGESSVGLVYAADALGAIAGVFVAIHLLIPYLGIKPAMIMAAAGDILLGAVLLRRSPVGAQRRLYLAALGVATVTIVLSAILVDFDPNVLSAGVYRSGLAKFDKDDVNIIYYRDGKTSSVSVLDYRDGQRVILTNGKPDASIQMNPAAPPGPDESPEVMMGILPLALHRDPREVANIGFGSGLTTHILLGDPRVRRVDTVEIEPAMYEGAMAFRSMVGRAYDDPRSHVYFDDAKTYFASRQHRYDVIVSEPSNPWVTGVASLFSSEFYRFVPRYLKPGGLFVQWVQLYEIDDKLVASVINSLNTSFKDYKVFLSNDSDMVIVASADGRLPDFQLPTPMQPDLHWMLEREGLNSTLDLGFHEIGDRSSLTPLAAALSEQANSDFYPLLSLEAPRARFKHVEASGFEGLANADLPYVEALGGVGPFQPQAITLNQGFRRSLLLSRAATLAADLSGRTGAAHMLDEGTQGDIAMAESLGRCGTEVDAFTGVDVLLRLAGGTIPYLPPDQLQRVWTHPAWLHCAPKQPQLTDTLALLDALSRRDWAAAGRGAAALLDSGRASLSDFAADYLLRVAILSAIQQRDFVAVRHMDETWGAEIPPNDVTRVQRAYLLAYADQAMGTGQ